MPPFRRSHVSEKTTNICIMDRSGAVEREGVVETSPKAIVGFLRGQRTVAVASSPRRNRRGVSRLSECPSRDTAGEHISDLAGRKL
jgi:hypothetical protein